MDLEKDQSDQTDQTDQTDQIDLKKPGPVLLPVYFPRKRMLWILRAPGAPGGLS